MNQLPKITILGKEYQSQNIIAAGLALSAVVVPFLNQGGSKEIPLPENANQLIMADIANVASEAKEAGAESAQFNGVIATDVSREAIAQASINTVEASNTLSASGQLFLLALVEERKTELISQYEKESNNPKNQNCYAIQWNIGSCLNSILLNRKNEWDNAKGTPEKDDDLTVAFNNLVLSLATQEIISRSLTIETPLVDYYEAHLKRDGLKVNSEVAFAQLKGAQVLLSKQFEELQIANQGAIADISSQSKEECLAGGTLNAELLKKCGGAEE